nr:polyketide synthase [Colletotrichum truncatum]KAF6785063.1 polyketide synthase [Colletotrichum truncatum]
MINGLARTLRSELKTDITVVEVDTEDGDITSLSKGLINIVKHLPLRRFNDGINPDFEFALTRGAVKVPRFHCTTIQEELSRKPGIESSNSRSVVLVE